MSTDATFSNDDIRNADAPQPGPCEATETIREQTQIAIEKELWKACEELTRSSQRYHSLDVDDIISEANFAGDITTTIPLTIDLHGDQSLAVEELGKLLKDLGRLLLGEGVYHPGDSPNLTEDE